MPEFLPTLSTDPVVLASASRVRANLLRAAGVSIEVVPSGIDEAAVMEAVKAEQGEMPPADLAAMLAETKAVEVGARRLDALVIGADQTLELDGQLFVKAASVDEARRSLLRLRGKTHALHSSVAIAVEGAIVWRYSETAWLTMRDFTPQFLGRYLAAIGDSVLESVGGYHLEHAGIQLFERVEGDWFAILGLPMIPVLDELRRHRVLPE